jgi:tetratricopeptide (TPR) repeat protein
MLNIIELESRWFKYKVKSYLPHFSILISLVIVFSFVQKPSVDSIPKEEIIKKEVHTNLKLSPSLDLMKKMQNTDSVILDKLLVKTVSTQPTSKKISIKRQNTQDDIHDIIKRFKNNNNPALSLFVAKKYYELGNYHQAYNYSLITNKINKEIKVSWIIFAKSLVKLGKKDKAISILKKYIQQSNSSSAQILLDEIRTGKFQ